MRFISCGDGTKKRSGSRCVRSAKPRSHRIEGYCEAILDAIEANKDITLVELAAWLAREHALCVAPSTVHRFLVRHRITLKKSRRTPASRSARTWRGGGRPGSTASPTSTQNA